MSRARWLGWLCCWLACAGCHMPVLWVGSAQPEDHAPDAGASADGSATLRHGAPLSAAATALDGGATAAPTQSAPMQPSAAAGARAPGAAGRGAAPPSPDEADAGPLAPPASVPVMPPIPRRMPSVNGECPELSGPGAYTFRVAGRSLSVQIHVLPKAQRRPGAVGPLILYFHAVGSSASEAVMGLGQDAIDRVVNQGGLVAAFNAVPCLSCGVDDVVWYDEDDAVSDQVVACVHRQLSIDLRHIHSVGFSAGALHSMHLALARSDFIASVVSYSGGLPVSQPEPQDPANKVPALLSFGRKGLDNALADFNIASHDWYDMYTPRGYYVLMCNHNGGHMIPSDLVPYALPFLLDHPYRVAPEPYRDKPPSELPSYCHNGP